MSTGYKTINPLNVDYVVKNKDKKIIGRVTAIVYHWKIMHVTHLWVDENYRHQNIGTLLIKKIEAEAKKLNCSLIHLETYSFQAIHFYLKLHYFIFGELKDCPPGHTKFFFEKRLSFFQTKTEAMS